MEFAGIKKLTLLDWPGKTACIVFTAGCGLRCRFCHNPEMVLPKLVEAGRADRIPESAVLAFLETRRGLLDGVVICGGEPTLQPDLADFCRKVKGRGFLVKLDTNGQRPDVVRAILDARLADFVAMDFKHAPGKYDALTGVPGSGGRALESAAAIVASGVDHEFRTTVAKGEHTAQDVAAICGALRGARRYALQNFRPCATLDPAFPGTAFAPQELAELAAAAAQAGLPCSVRS